HRSPALLPAARPRFSYSYRGGRPTIESLDLHATSPAVRSSRSPRDQLSLVLNHCQRKARFMTGTLVIIPARLQATRLPGKPLADIHGRPMIVHVWERAMAADVGRVVVATDTREIADAIKSAGGEAVMTRPDHASGSDRIFEALQHADPNGKAAYIVNLQGD